MRNNRDCGLVSPTTYDEKGNLTYNSGYFPEKGMKDEPVLIEGDICVNTVLGSSMLISKKLFQELEGFDEFLFLYFSDDELCKRINKKISVIQSLIQKLFILMEFQKLVTLLKGYLREFHYTFDEMYYYYKLKIENNIINKNKKRCLII